MNRPAGGAGDIVGDAAGIEQQELSPCHSPDRAIAMAGSLTLYVKAVDDTVGAVITVGDMQQFTSSKKVKLSCSM